MDFSDKELKVLLQALYRYRGEVSGATQSEQNKMGSVVKVIAKIEGEIGPIKPERTGFDREMEESLAVLATGKAGTAKARAKAAEARNSAAAEEGPVPAGKAGRGAGKAALDKKAPVPKASKDAGTESKGKTTKAASENKLAGGGKAGQPKNKAK